MLCCSLVTCLVYCVFIVVMWVIVDFDLWLYCFCVALLFVATVELVFADCCCVACDLV